MRMLRHLLAAVLAVLTITTAGLSGEPQRGRTRIVAIGDVHGAADAFAAILRRAGLIDEAGRWTGGRTILVQTGDMTDRGAGMRAALDLLMSLERQADRAGGKVHALLGNHEVMNLTGELRDASPEIIASFGGETAMREAFGPRGQYGRWLRNRPVVVSIERTVFMHAGINPVFTKESLDEINRRAHREIAAWDEGVRWLVREKRVPASPGFREAFEAARAEIEKINAAADAGEAPPDAARIANLLLPVANIGFSSLFAPEGPLWFRGFATWPDDEGAAQIAALAKQHRADRFVTGHTPQPGRIRTRFDGAVFLIDTGMLGPPFFSTGRPSALELQGTGVRELYLEQ